MNYERIFLTHSDAEDELEFDRSSNRISGRWPEMTSLSCRSRGSERIDSRAALDRR